MVFFFKEENLRHRPALLPQESVPKKGSAWQPQDRQHSTRVWRAGCIGSVLQALFAEVHVENHERK